MDEEHRHVALLLTRVADDAGPFEAPPLTSLPGRRRRSVGPVLAGGATAATVLALAVALSTTGAQHDPTTRRDTASPREFRPAPPTPDVPVSALKTYRWSALPTAPIVARSNASSAWTGHDLIVWGGQTSRGLRDDGAVYDPVSRTWTVLPAAPLTPRAGALSAWVAGRFVVWGGGALGGGKQASDGASYDPTTRAWATLPAAPVSSYGWAQLVVVGDRAVLLSTPRYGQQIVHVDAYDPATGMWRTLPDLTAPADHQISSVAVLVAGDTVYVWLDWYRDVPSPANSVTIYSGVDSYSLDTSTGRWATASLKPGHGYSDNPIWTGRQILLVDEYSACGPCDSPLSLGPPSEAIDPQTGRRTSIPTGPLSLESLGYFWTGSALLSLGVAPQGGTQNHRTYRGNTAVWDPGTNRWARVASATLSGDPAGAVRAWTGTELLVWGVAGPSAGLQFAPVGS